MVVDGDDDFLITHVGAAAAWLIVSKVDKLQPHRCIHDEDPCCA
jgi:hypothetical protein